MSPIRRSCLCYLALPMLVSTVTLLSGEEPADGFYTIVDTGGTEVARTDGGTVRLGRLVAETFGTVTIRSTTIDNTRFSIHFEDAAAFPASEPVRVAARIAGVVVVIGSYRDPDVQGRTNLAGMIDGREDTDAIADRLDVTPVMMKHPGHKIITTFAPAATTFPVGEPVTLNMSIENVGTTTVAFFDGGMQRGPRNNQFRFIGWGDGNTGFGIPDTGDRTNHGGMAGFIRIAPGETFTKDVTLSDWFKFDAAGRYSITGLYQFDLYESEGDWHTPIWHDFAVGTCTVEIVPAADGRSEPADR